MGELSKKPSSKESSKEPSPPKSTDAEVKKETGRKPSPAKEEKTEEPVDSWNDNDGWEDDDDDWGDMEV